MHYLRTAAGFVAAAVAAAALGTVSSTQFVLQELADLGVTIPLDTRLWATWHDLMGMAPTLAAVVTPGLLVAFLAGALVVRFAGVLRTIVYAVAGAATLVIAVLVMREVLGVTPISGARTAVGLMGQGAAGLIAGWLFAMVSRPRGA